jgi:hypothetical protein
VERFATDLDLKLDEDTGLLTEKLFLKLKPVLFGLLRVVVQGES